MKKATIPLTIAIVLTALIIFDSHQAQAAPSVKKIEVTDGGVGPFVCSASTIFPDGVSSSAGVSTRLHAAATADKITGKISGTWQIIDFFSGNVLAAGDLTGGKMKADSFTLSGIETFSPDCGPTPIPVTFTGQCGNDVVISFKADKQQPDLVQTQTAVFRDASVSCTK